MFLLLSPLLLFQLLFLDPPLHLLHPLIHIQPLLLSFRSRTWRCPLTFSGWSREFIMIYSIFVSLFAIFKPVSMIPIVGTLGLFHFREATHSKFLWWVLRSTHEYLLQLFPRHQHLQKTQIFRRIDPFVDDKRGERFYGVILGCLLLCLNLEHIWIYVCICALLHFSIWWTYVFMWYVSCFEVGMNLCVCMDKFMLWYLSLLSLHTYGMWYICTVKCFLYNPTIYHLLLEVGGKMDGWRETVCAYTVIILYTLYA